MCCHTLEKAFQHFFQISLVLLSCWLKREASEDQERLNNPKPKHSPALQMLPSGLQDSFYLFISLKIPPQIPSLSTWLQSSKWDRVGSGHLFYLENIHTITSLKKWLCYGWQLSDFFPCICLIAASSGCCSWEQRLTAATVSLQGPSKTLEHLPQLQGRTEHHGMVLLCTLTKPEDLCMGGAPCHYAHSSSHCCIVQTSCSQPCAEWSAFSSSSGCLSGPNMKHHSSTPQASHIYLIYKLREDLTLLHATEHQNSFSILIDNSTPSLYVNNFFSCGFLPHISFNYCALTHGKWKLLYGECSILLSVKLTQPGWLLK